jgi:shikimate kinase
MHVALVGLMGSGKTTVGRRAAKLLGRPFVDADEAFIPRYGRTVADVFAVDGEAGFRRLEAELLAELLDVATPLVVACGGGVVTTEGNRQRLRQPDVHVVWLRANPNFLASRAQQKPDRPLLAGDDPAAVLARLHDEREAWYAEVADDVLEVGAFHEWGSQPKRAMAEKVAELVRARELAA